jgi:shikimate dehydrogenase|tara:strand:+ start:1515 stop:2372 length:858 start_codon:yes stop_codon:yes gene_type:complete
MISGKTKICGLIGDPIEHSMSPAMHNTAFKNRGLDYVYLPFRVAKARLGEAILGVKALNIRGLNVTIPHKVSVIPLLDELDPLAEKIGAVNTIINNDGVLKGYNTDAHGFLRAMLEQDIEPDGKSIVMLGAGGASRAISFILAERGANLVILNRQLELDWAVKLGNSISRTFGRKVKALELNEQNLTPVLRKANILVNTTSVGMRPNTNETPIPARLLESDLVVFDIVYNPVKTKLLTEAESAGAKAISGLEMLVWQGALAFEMWTGLTAPLEIMRKATIRALKK